MALINLRNALVSGKKWKNPYITNGLLAMWDGEWNAGGGKHDPNATTWKDIVGSYDLTLGTSSRFESNRLFVDGPRERGAAYRNETIPQSNVETVEMIAKVDSGVPNAWILFINDTLAANSSNLCIILRASGSEGMMRTAKVSSIYTRDTLLHSYTATKDTGYVDASALTSRSYANDFINHGYLCLWGRNGNTNYQPFVGKIYCVRVYRRPLTAQEIAANYAIDKARFGLP